MLESLGPVPYFDDMIDLNNLKIKTSSEMYLSLASSINK
jgi:hypothetical protein